MYPEVGLLCDLTILFLLFIQFFAPSYIPTCGSENSSLLPDEGASELHMVRPVERRGQRHMELGREEIFRVFPKSSHVPSPWPPHARFTPPPSLIQALSPCPQKPPCSVPAPASWPQPPEVLFHGLHRHCHYRVPFHFSSCSTLSLSVWDVSQTPVLFQCLPSFCILSVAAAAFQTRRFGDTTHHKLSSHPANTLFLSCFCDKG